MFEKASDHDFTHGARNQLTTTITIIMMINSPRLLLEVDKPTGWRTAGFTAASQ